MNGGVKVSVWCIAYNHKDYIRNAMESILMQETNFRYEILVHDDASTDGTADILREYQNKYPDLVRVVFQTENQYTKNPNYDPGLEYLLPLTQGEYIAIISGDDYWTDSAKLQKQVDCFEENSECMLCAHRTRWCFDGSSGDVRIFPEQEDTRRYVVEEMIRRHRAEKSEVVLAASSFMYRRQIYETLPTCFQIGVLSDYTAPIYAALCGEVICLQDILGAYNYRSSGSWTKSIKENREYRLQQNRIVLESLKRIFDYCGQQYGDTLLSVIRYYEYHINKQLGNLEAIRGEEYEEFRLRDEMRLKQRVEK